MALQKEQKALTELVTSYYSSNGPCGEPDGKPDRNSRMAAIDLPQSALKLENLPLLSTEQAKALRIHHHYGLGSMGDPTSLTQEELTNVLYKLESNQVKTVLTHMEPMGPSGRILDAGSGRGGTAFTIYDLYKPEVYGVNISEYQAKYSQKLAEISGRKKVHFMVMDMTYLDFQDSTFDRIVANETDMYIADLSKLYQEFGRVLKRGGRFVNATWCMNGSYSDSQKYADPIDTNYWCKMQADTTYVPALKEAGFRDIEITDYTQLAFPYWEYRKRWNDRSGVEQYFIDGYKEGRLRYLIISAQKPR